ncbi:excalibur calcium-binding domain-containing protein [Streptomyces sp. NPDC059373]
MGGETVTGADINDPLNLLAVDYSSNRIKGDADAATWLPPNKSFRCAYVARQAAVKKKYGVWVTQAEQTTMRTVLNTCPGEKLPDSGKPVASGAPVTDPSSSAPAETTHYANCDAVRKAGAAPLHKGDPGYSRSLDRDGDGVACAG